MRRSRYLAGRAACAVSIRQRLGNSFAGLGSRAVRVKGTIRVSGTTATDAADRLRRARRCRRKRNHLYTRARSPLPFSALGGNLEGCGAHPHLPARRGAMVEPVIPRSMAWASRRRFKHGRTPSMVYRPVILSANTRLRSRRKRWWIELPFKVRSPTELPTIGASSTPAPPQWPGSPPWRDPRPAPSTSTAAIAGIVLADHLAIGLADALEIGQIFGLVA